MADAFSGFVEGFQGHQEEEYKRNYEQDAARRQQETELYKYLLQSQDPEMRTLAMSGMFENAAGGKRKKGLRGAMGEIQGGQFYPLVKQRMDEMIPAESEPAAPPTSPTPSSAPGSAAMSTNQAVTPGASPIQLPPPMGGPTGGMGPANSEMGGGGAPLGPTGSPSGGMALPPPPPPESKWKRRGTGVPTAEEIAETRSRVELENKIKTVGTAILANGGTPEDVKRAVMGMVGAPPTMDATANGPVYADPNDPETPIPTIRHRDGSITLADGTPLPPGMVGYVKPTSGGRVTKTMADKTSPTGYMSVTYSPTGQEIFRVPTEFTPPPAYSGAATAVDANGNPVIIGVPRQGVPGNVIAQAPSNQPTQEQSDATALLAEVDKAIADAEVPKLAGFPKKPLLPAQKDQVTRERAAAGGLPYTTYLEVQRAARQQRRPSPAPTQPKPAEKPGGGGSALSMADQIRADLLQRQKAVQPATPPPPAPPRAGGPGPVR
jgi:hypothetical protein